MTDGSLSGFTDPRHLRHVQYRDSGNLDARISLHQRFSTNLYGWHRWYFERLNIPSPARILEIGCGSGALWSENKDRIPAGWDITLADLSPGMLEDARRNLATIAHPFAFVEADAQSMPLPDAPFDAVLANHMLYHVPDRARALGEIRRVLKPGGRLYAATNGREHLHELLELVQQAHISVPLDRDVGFTLENGAQQLADFFEHVTLERYPDGLRVTEGAPLKAFIRSMSDHYRLNKNRIARIDALIDERLARDGAIHIGKATGVFTAY